MTDVALPVLATDGDSDTINQIDNHLLALNVWLAAAFSRDDAPLLISKLVTQFGVHAPQANALASFVKNGNGLEWGHSNTGGWRCHLGCESSTGKPWIAFNAEQGTNADTYRTRGKAGVVIRAELDGTLTLGKVALANADNQTLTDTIPLLPTAWTALGSGINTGAGWSASTAVPQYRKVGDEVQLRGRITSPGGGGSSQPATLPVGFRPAVAYEGVTRAGSGGEIYGIYVATTGVITINNTPSSGGVVLDPVRFSTVA